jgi:uncharacterized protein YoxC
MANNDQLLQELKSINKRLDGLEKGQQELRKDVETVDLKAEAHFAALNRKIDQGNEQILDTIIHTTDGILAEVKKEQEKLEKRVERLEEETGIHRN